MAKTVIINAHDGTETPFLRGILISSLTEAGLSFDDAYNLASKIRSTLADTDKLTTHDMRELVVRELIKRDEALALENYTSDVRASLTLQIRDTTGDVNPFSVVRHRQSLQSAGVSAENAILMTQLLLKELEETKKKEFDVNTIGRMTHRILKQQLGNEAAKRYLIWIDYTRSGRPLILLIGGTTGCGKSTIATEVAHRLGIIRTQSTDMLREVMRMMIPERLIPTLHTSSFNAWQKLRGHTNEKVSNELIIIGYENQADLVSVPCEAVIQRALRERVSLILEGIHISPSILDRLDNQQDAVIVPMMLAVLKPDQLKQHLQGRGVVAPNRDSSDYLSHFKQIWELQSHLLSEADKSTMDIITNDDKEKTTERVMRSINAVLARDFSVKVDDIFGTQ